EEGRQLILRDSEHLDVNVLRWATTQAVANPASDHECSAASGFNHLCDTSRDDHRNICRRHGGIILPRTKEGPGARLALGETGCANPGSRHPFLMLGTYETYATRR